MRIMLSKIKMYRNLRRNLSLGRPTRGSNIVWTVPKPVSTKESTVSKSEHGSKMLRETEQSIYPPSNAPLHTCKIGPEGNVEVVEFGQCELSPEIWMTPVDQDVIYSALQWQNKYKTVDMSFEQSRLEVGQKRYSKPWQVKSLLIKIQSRHSLTRKK